MKSRQVTTVLGNLWHLDPVLTIGVNFLILGLLLQADRGVDNTDQAGTVVMVTHNLNGIRKTCDRAIWLDAGRLVLDGAAEETLAADEGSD